MVAENVDHRNVRERSRCPAHAFEPNIDIACENDELFGTLLVELRRVSTKLEMQIGIDTNLHQPTPSTLAGGKPLPGLGCAPLLAIVNRSGVLSFRCTTL